MIVATSSQGWPNTVSASGWTQNGTLLTENGLGYRYTAAGPVDTTMLVCTNFGFSIPENATLSYFTVRIRARKFGVGDTSSLIYAKLKDATGDNSTDLFAEGASILLSSYQPYTFLGTDSPDGFWEPTRAWTPAKINDSTFGFDLKGNVGTGNSWLEVDAIRITINYSAEIGESSQSRLIRPGLHRPLPFPGGFPQR